MLHSRHLLAASLLVFALPAWADEPKEVKVITSIKEVSRDRKIGPILLQKNTPIVIRSAEELVAASTEPKSAKYEEVQKTMEAALAKIIKVETIDWKKQMVVVGIVEGIDSVKSDGKVLTVTFVRYAERPTRAVPPSPKVVALVERFEGEVKFVPKEGKKDPEE